MAEFVKMRRDIITLLTLILVQRLVGRLSLFFLSLILPYIKSIAFLSVVL